MLTIEEQAEALFGLSTGLLMERAGQAVAEEAERMLSGFGNILIVCGKGNNGGDGFVAARLLNASGYSITVFSLAHRDDFPPAAQAAFDNLPEDMNLITEPDLGVLDDALVAADLVIDAIFGFSLKGAVRGVASEVIDRINASRKMVLSVDMPSGLEADTGKVYGSGIDADITVTFTAPKVGMLLHPGIERSGEYIIADIGIPQSLVDEHSGFRALDRLDVFDLLPARKVDAYKNTVGRILVIAGSRDMTGAAVLVARGAYKIGAGLVVFGPPAGITPVLHGAVVEAIVRPQAETEAGALSVDAYEPLIELSAHYDVIAIGPGLTTNEQTAELVRKLVAKIEKPMVIDADGLNAVAGNVQILKDRKAETVITPHPGEMARLMKASTQDVLDDPIGFSRRAAEEFGVVAVLKGAVTITSSRDESTINTTGNPGLATAGTGDVLTGFIAGLIGQGLSAYDAASVGVYLHGLSADIAVEDMSEYCLMASDVVDYLPEAILYILG